MPGTATAPNVAPPKADEPTQLDRIEQKLDEVLAVAKELEGVAESLANIQLPAPMMAMLGLGGRG